MDTQVICLSFFFIITYIYTHTYVNIHISLNFLYNIYIMNILFWSFFPLFLSLFHAISLTNHLIEMDSNQMYLFSFHSVSPTCYSVLLYRCSMFIQTVHIWWIFEGFLPFSLTKNATVNTLVLGWPVLPVCLELIDFLKIWNFLW